MASGIGIGSTVFSRSLKFDKSHCTHCNGVLSLDQQQQNQKESSRMDVREDEDLWNCYAVLFEYALKSSGNSIDFRQVLSSSSHSTSTTQIPSIYSSFCLNCQFTFRQFYKYYKRFVLSASSKSFVKYIMKDSFIWKAAVRRENFTESTGKCQGRVNPSTTFTHEQSQAGYCDYDSDTGGDPDYVPSPIADQDQEVEVAPLIRIKQTTFSKRPVVKLKRIDADPDFNPGWNNSACSEENIDLQKKSVKFNDETKSIISKSGATGTARSLRSSTRSVARKSFKELLGSSSEDESENQKKRKLSKMTIVKKRSLIGGTNPKPISSRLLGAYLYKQKNREEYLKVKRQDYANAKLKTRPSKAFLSKLLKQSKMFKLNSNGKPELIKNTSSYRKPDCLSQSQIQIERMMRFKSTCRICQRKFPFISLLLSHMRTAHPDQVGAHRARRFQCRYCPETFAMKQYKKNHETENHLPELLKKTVPCKYEGCDKLFRTSKDSSKHYERVHNESNEICHTCGKVFRNRGALRQHLRFHQYADNPADLFKCEECGKGYNNPFALRRHKQHHEDKQDPEKKVLCSLCGTSFAYRSGLNRHMKTKHADGETNPLTSTATGDSELPFRCEVCGKGWRRKDHLIQHQRGKGHGNPWPAEGHINKKIKKQEIPSLGRDQDICNSETKPTPNGSGIHELQPGTILSCQLGMEQPHKIQSTRKEQGELQLDQSHSSQSQGSFSSTPIPIAQADSDSNATSRTEELYSDNRNYLQFVLK